jgi:hypothetical protein
MEIALPGLGPDRVREERAVAAVAQAVASAILLVVDPAGEVVGRPDGVVDDHALAKGRPDDLVSVGVERGEHGGESSHLDDRRLVD